MTTETVREGYRHCQQVTRAAARNFYCAFITLPRPQRMAIYAAYAFARICDDIADDDLAPLEKARRLAEVRRDLHTACQGQPRGPVFSALGDVVSRYSVPERYLQDIIKGVEMDLTITRYEDFPALMEYCRHVASAVGLICTRIFGGADASLEPLASDLGV
ncbi:MAG: hypothetical protein FJ315_00240, partial [SAR202 cluster bacterium]|nr:hypothetical protein [SAR202 cluster bacterium]